MVKNILAKLLLFRDTFEEKTSQNGMFEIIEKDAQWRFYAELNKLYCQA